MHVTSVSRKSGIFVLIVALSLLIYTIALSGSLSWSNSGFAQELNSYYAELTGDSEVPPVSTEATGNSTFQFTEGNTELSYVVSVSAIDNVIAAHIHQGDETENGPIVLTLYDESDQQQLPEGDIAGVLTAGNATAADLEGPLSGQDLANLIGVINEGDAYVNVHTTDYPEGEIRGTIVNSSLIGVPSIPPT
jgi:hypothetical protein